MADEFIGFPKEAVSFWKGLEKNNTREWFQAHKAQYEEAVRRPMQLLIDELAPWYGAGRISRINKDMRFQKEKPYKSYLATHLGGSYISLSKEGLWVGTGIYKPEPATLRRLREAIAGDRAGRELTTIIARLRRKGFEVDTHARLEKPPRGYDAAHPRADLLRMKDIYVGRLFSAGEMSSPGVVRGVVQAMSGLEPFRVWLRRYVPDRQRASDAR